MTKPIVPSSERIALVLADIETEHTSWIDLLASLTVEEKTSRPDGAWSAIDMLSHITAWQENALRIARLQSAPDAPGLDPHRSPAGILHINVDQFNAEVCASHRDWTPDQVLRWSDEVNVELRGLLAALPAEHLLGGRGPHGACQWYGRPAIVHSREHRRALEQQIARKLGRLSRGRPHADR